MSEDAKGGMAVVWSGWLMCFVPLAAICIMAVACSTPPPPPIDVCAGMRRIETHQDTLIQGSSRYNALTAGEWAARRDVKGDILSVETARAVVSHNRAVAEFCGR